MPEDAGKKKFIKDFLVSVQAGEGFIEDIFIDRSIRSPGSPGEESTARSLSGRSINNITELLEDDLRYSFEEGYFTFRIVSALMGSGKTSLLTYLHELIMTKAVYRDFYIVNRFSLTKIASMGGNQNFTVKLYCYMLAETFYSLLDSKSSVRDKAKNILQTYLEHSEFSQLVSASDPELFRIKFINYFSKIPIQFENFFFKVITEISDTVPQYTFAYLIDEFDGLENRSYEIQQTSMIIKTLIKEVSQRFKSKIRLFIYLVGTSDNIKNFFSQDRVIESLIGNQVINLSAGYGNEFEMIRDKIDRRIEGAFKGYKYFTKAWEEIKKIPLNPAKSLRKFCQDYAKEVLKIYQKYFKEEPEKQFEGNARELVESQCRQKWEKYLKQKSYSLSSGSTTTVLEGHAFDCYAELCHNGFCVARCFGEAKNYDLLSSHLETFDQWLEDVKFKHEGTPPDLAFMIAPDCPPLLQRKLELKNICFIRSGKISPIVNPDPKPILPPVKPPKNSVNINTAEKDLIKKAVQGTGIHGKTIDKLINLRKVKSYKNLDELASDLKLNQNVKDKLQKKLDEGEICFFSEYLYPQ